MTTLVKKVATGALAALTLGGATLATATPASAQHWRGGYGYHGGYHRGYGGAGLAIAGLTGLAVGAAIAGDRPYYGGYYAPGYAYAPGYYYGPRYGYYYGRPYYWHHRCGYYRCW